MVNEHTLYERLGEPKVKLNKNMSNVVVVDGLPCVPQKKHKKLLSFIRKKFTQLGNVDPDSFFMPVDDDERSYGYCFMEFSSVEEAIEVSARADGALFDKKTRMRVTHWDDFQKYENVEGLIEEEHKLREDHGLDVFDRMEDIQGWLLDGRDQFVMRFLDETEVHWNDPIYKKSERVERENEGVWTERYVSWSPKGSYLATYHEQGLKLWGGPEFGGIVRFNHANVKYINFSPCEKYLVTFNADVNDPNAMIVWEVLRGAKLRTFPFSKFLRKNPGWPVIKWSPSGQYAAAGLGDGKLSVFSLPSMELSGQIIRVPGMQQFDWSPTDDVIAYWYPESENNPAAVCLMEFPSREIIRSQFLYQVTDVRMNWHPQGDYLCVKVGVMKKNLESSNFFNIFKMRDKGIPVEAMEIKQPVVAFNFEPMGDRFGLTYGEGSNLTTGFYSIKKEQIEPEFEIVSSTNGIYWSPIGNYCVLSGIGSSLNGVLIFISANQKRALKELQHYQHTDIEWDPSGRYVMSSVTRDLKRDDRWSYDQNNGYKLWKFSGELAVEHSQKRLFQIMWRPRPPSLLSEEDKTDIRKNLRERYYRDFDEDDENIRQSMLTGDLKRRAEAKEDYLEYRAVCEDYLDEIHEERLEIIGYDDDEEEDWETVEVYVEEEIFFDENIIEEV